MTNMLSLLLIQALALGVAESLSVRCGAKADIVFLMDSSGSIGADNWKKQLKFASDLTKEFTIGPDDVRFGSIIYSSSPDKQFYLKDHDSSDSLSQAILSTNYKKGPTYTNRALNAVGSYDMFSTANGGRDDATDIIIVFTDGISTRPQRTKASAEALKKQNIQIISLGIGKASEEELKAIASSPENVFTASSFEVLDSIKKKLAERTCEVPAAPVTIPPTYPPETEPPEETEPPAAPETEPPPETEAPSNEEEGGFWWGAGNQGWTYEAGNWEAAWNNNGFWEFLGHLWNTFNIGGSGGARWVSGEGGLGGYWLIGGEKWFWVQGSGGQGGKWQNENGESWRWEAGTGQDQGKWVNDQGGEWRWEIGSGGVGQWVDQNRVPWMPGRGDGLWNIVAGLWKPGNQIWNLGIKWAPNGGGPGSGGKWKIGNEEWRWEPEWGAGNLGKWVNPEGEKWKWVATPGGQGGYFENGKGNQWKWVPGQGGIGGYWVDENGDPWKPGDEEGIWNIPGIMWNLGDQKWNIKGGPEWVNDDGGAGGQWIIGGDEWKWIPGKGGVGGRWENGKGQYWMWIGMRGLGGMWINQNRERYNPGQANGAFDGLLNFGGGRWNLGGGISGIKFVPGQGGVGGKINVGGVTWTWVPGRGGKGGLWKNGRGQFWRWRLGRRGRPGRWVNRKGVKARPGRGGFQALLIFLGSRLNFGGGRWNLGGGRWNLGGNKWKLGSGKWHLKIKNGFRIGGWRFKKGKRGRGKKWFNKNGQYWLWKPAKGKVNWINERGQRWRPGMGGAIEAILRLTAGGRGGGQWTIGAGGGGRGRWTIGIGAVLGVGSGGKWTIGGGGGLGGEGGGKWTIGLGGGVKGQAGGGAGGKWTIGGHGGGGWKIGGHGHGHGHGKWKIGHGHRHSQKWKFGLGHGHRHSHKLKIGVHGHQKHHGHWVKKHYGHRYRKHHGHRHHKHHG